MKVGNYLYRVRYINGWDGSKRKLEKYKITKVNPKSVDIWLDRIRKYQIGTEWFLSELEAYQNTLERHLDKYGETMKEIKFLKNKINKLKEKAVKKK